MSGQVAPEPQGAVSQSAVEAAVLGAAAKAWQPIDRASLRVTTESVIWADGALGCPLPGQTYTQALEPGWRLVVRNGDQELHFHASRRGRWMVCGSGRIQQPLPGAAVTK